VQNENGVSVFNWITNSQRITEESIKLVDDFFKHILDNLRKWDIAAIVPRKGYVIYLDQIMQKQLLNSLPQISTEEIAQNEELIRDKSILLFDDAINRGDTLRGVLESLKKYAPNKITIAVLIGREDSINLLRLNFPNVEILCALIKNKEDFTKAYWRLISPYLDYACLPVNRDALFELEFDADACPSKEDIVGFFSRYGTILISKEFPDRFKGAFYFKDDHSLNDLGLYSLAKSIGSFDKRSQSVISIRIYLRINKDSKGCILLLQPIMLEFVIDSENVDRALLERVEAYTKKSIIIDFFMRELIPYFETKKNAKVHKYKINV